MKVFGLEITRQLTPVIQAEVVEETKQISVNTSQGWLSPNSWWSRIYESFAGAWQQNVVINTDTVLSFFAVYACISLISSDIAKMRLKLVKQDADGIWDETESPAFSPFIRKPNHFQTRVKFYEWWITSKLIHGNTYALKQRDARGVVTAAYILDPLRVEPLIAPDGSVFYRLKQDNLAGLDRESLVVPAREIFHDILCALFHPLIGVSPIFACGLAATQGLKIQNNQLNFFANGSAPSGVLTAPGHISQETADRVKEYWETNFTGEKAGSVAMLGDDMKYQPMTMNAVDAQLIEQLKMTALIVCACFHVPPHMIGVEGPPNYNNIEALNSQYYAQCIQTLLESLELVLDEGLGLAPDTINGVRYGVEFEVDDLLRMDTATLIESEKAAITAGLKKPNESRKRLNLKPVTGGDTCYLQQQQFSLAALDRRDQAEAAPASTTPTQALPPPADTPDQGKSIDMARLQSKTIRRLMELRASA